MIYINGCSWTDKHIFRDELMNADVPVINNASSGYSNFQIVKHSIFDLKYFAKYFDKIYAIIFLTEAFRSEYEYKLLKNKEISLQELAKESLLQMKAIIDKSLPNNVKLICSTSFVDIPWKTKLPSMLTIACKSHKIKMDDTKCYTTQANKLLKTKIHRPNVEDLETIINRCKTIEKIPLQTQYHLQDNISYIDIVKQIKEITNG